MNDAQYQSELDKINKQIEESRQAITILSSKNAQDTWWSTTNAMTISASVLVFGLVISILAAVLLKQGRHADSILKTLGTILIIVSALFLVVAGYSDKQIAPVIGLFGTIAGYLLGKNSNEPKDLTGASSERPKQSAPPPVSAPTTLNDR